MSTRAHIRFESGGGGTAALLWQRADGCPSNVVPRLREAVRRFGGDWSQDPGAIAALYLWLATAEALRADGEEVPTDPWVIPVVTDEDDADYAYVLRVTAPRVAQLTIRSVYGESTVYDGALDQCDPTAFQDAE